MCWIVIHPGDATGFTRPTRGSWWKPGMPSSSCNGKAWWSPLASRVLPWRRRLHPQQMWDFAKENGGFNHVFHGTWWFEPCFRRNMMDFIMFFKENWGLTKFWPWKQVIQPGTLVSFIHSLAAKLGFQTRKTWEFTWQKMEGVYPIDEIHLFSNYSPCFHKIGYIQKIVYTKITI